MSKPPIISVRHLTKRYDDFVAVDDISFEVQPGEIFGIVGPNGAGKTSAIVAGQLLFMPMIFVSGATMPRSLLPDGIQAVSEWLPMTHIVTLMQDLWFGRGWPMGSVGVLLGILVVSGGLSAWLFRWE